MRLSTRQNTIKYLIMLILMALLVALFSCTKVSPDAVELKVDFTWEGLVPCAPGGNPEIRVSGVPGDTRILRVTLHDHDGVGYTRQTMPYDGTDIIQKGSLDEISEPCPFFEAAQYTYEIAAVDENGVIIGIGSKKRFFPEEK